MEHIATDKHPYNAECCIDYKKKSVDFNYIQEISRKNNWIAYKADNPFTLIAIIISLLLFFRITKLTIYWITWFYTYGLGFTNKEANAFILIICLIISGLYFATFQAMRGISILIFSNIDFFKKRFPYFGGFFSIVLSGYRDLFNLKRRYNFKKIDKDEFIRNNYIYINKKLIIRKFNIGCQRYELTKDCSKYIEKIYTVCSEDNEKKRKHPGVTNFSIIFQFKEKPENGEVILY